MRCHDGTESGAPLFTTFEAFADFAKPDTGMSIATLVRVSHIHLFGMTFIFFILGMIFSHAYLRPVWFKSLVIAVPFLTMITDIGSWYLTKLNPNFAWIIIASGVLMGLSFAFQWFVSMYQIWFYKYRDGNPDHRLPADGSVAAAGLSRIEPARRAGAPAATTAVAPLPAVSRHRKIAQRQSCRGSRSGAFLFLGAERLHVGLDVMQIVVGQHLAGGLIKSRLCEYGHDPHRPTMIVLAVHDGRLEDREIPVGRNRRRVS